GRNWLSVGPLKALLGVFTDFSLQAPGAALALKWFFYLTGGFLFALAVHTVIRVPDAERPLHVRGFHYAREGLFALGFLLAALLVTEPFIAENHRKANIFPVLRLPLAGGANPAASNNTTKSTFMNRETLLAMLLFF